MKAVLQNVKTGDVSLGDIPPPVLTPGNALIRNHFSLVSAGTEKAVLEFSNASYVKKARMRPDLFRKVLNRAKNEGLYQTYKIVTELLKQEVGLGYSSSGEIVDVGSEIDDLKVGDRVACAGLFFATHSEFVSVPRNLLSKVPEGVSSESASFATVCAIAMQAIRLAKLELGEVVVIYGLGLVGLIAAQMARASGCLVIGVDIDPSRKALAETFGIRYFAADSELSSGVMSLTKGVGADKVLLCAATKSNDPIEVVPGILRQKGVLVVLGDVSMNVPRRAYYDKEIDIRISRSYGPGRYDLSYEEGGVDYPIAYVRWTENRNMDAALQLMASGSIDMEPLLTHRFGIDNAIEAYEIVGGKRREYYLGILLEYDQKKPLNKIVEYSGRVSSSSGVSPAPRVAFVGAGNFAKAFLIPLFLRERRCSLVGVCSSKGISSATVAKRYGMKFGTSDPQTLISRSDVDAVVVATRHDTHAEYVIGALEAGKAVFVEKPLALNHEELNRVVNVYNKILGSGGNPLVFVGYNRRYSPFARRLKEAFRGRVKSIVYRVNAGNIPRSEWVHDAMLGGGRVVGECCHFIDFVSFLVGADPVEVSANRIEEGGWGIDDCVTIGLRYPDGSRGTVHYFSNGDSSMPKERVEVFGGGASAELVNFRKMKIYREGGKRVYRSLGQKKGYAEEVKAFVEMVISGKLESPSFSSLVATSRATFNVAEAVRSGKWLQVDDGGGAA